MGGRLRTPCSTNIAPTQEVVVVGGVAGLALPVRKQFITPAVAAAPFVIP